MAYTKNVWKDQDVQRPRTYEVINNQDSTITLNDSFGVVTEIGTPVNATNMNHIENGIADNDTAITTINSKIPNNASSVNKMITQEDVAPKLHALKGYSDNGELLTDAEGLADVIGYAHSTFDRSKFTVVGSPNITDDGIAIFNSSSRLKTGYTLNPSKGQSWKIKMQWEVTAEAISGAGTADAVANRILGNGNTPKCISLEDNPRFYWLRQYLPVYDFVAETNKIFYIDFRAESHNVYKPSVGDIVDYEVWYNTTDLFKARYRINNGTWVDGVANIDREYAPLTMSNYTLVGINPLGLGNWYDSGATYDKNRQNLKYFEVEVDDKVVFSGNKTGIDTIKPDNYTVVGTPTISADGVATDLIGKPITLPVGSISGDFDFEFQYTTADAIQTTWVLYNTGIFAILQASWGWTLSVYANNSAIVSANFGSSQTVRRANPVANTKYKFKFSRQGDTYTLGIQAEDEESMTTTTASNSTALDRTSIKIEQNSDNTYNFTVDLNKIHLFVNGNLVYQPCLKIPYTESKTGSKIVNAVYRDRVNDMAEQFGYANYYTLDEDNGNFTLPQVELYGYIEKRAKDIAHPVAVPFFRLTDEINEDEVRLEGAEVDKGLYLAIEQKLAAYCTASEDTTKIILPNFIDRVPWGSNTQGYIEAGLPNITGKVTVRGQWQGGEGAIYEDGGDEGRYRIEGGQGQGFSLDASRSSSIYGNSTTVQPPAFKVRWLARWR